ncbi:type II secretion system protein M [Vibrio sp. PP-XX7]
MNPWVNRCYSWWRSLSLREQRVVSIVVLFAIVGVIYSGVLHPLQEQKTMAINQMNAEQNLHDWVVKQANQIIGLRGMGGNSLSSEQPLNQVITNSTRQFGVRLIRIQPMSDGLQVWVEPLAFNQFIDWISFARKVRYACCGHGY